MNDLISVVVPVYNVENYLERCLDSLVNQTYKNLEIILINDGSSDNSLSICQKYAEKDKRVKVYSQENSGLSSARNKGVSLASGKYIGFVDSDDVISLKMYENLYKVMIENDSEIGLCDFVCFSEKPLFDDVFTYEKMNRIKALENLMIDRNITSHAVDKLYLKSLFDNTKYPIGQKFEDISTTFKLFMKANNIVYIPHALYGYYQRTGSITGSYSKSSTIDFINAVNNRYSELYNFDKKLNIYLDMNRVNSVLRYFLDIAMFRKKSVLKDLRFKKALYTELEIARRLNTTEIRKINTKKKNILLHLLFFNSNIFYYVMNLYFRFI